MYSTSQKKVPVPFPYNGGSTVLRLKKDCAKTFHERYGCVFLYCLRNVERTFVQCRSCIVHGWIEQAEATMTSYRQKISEKTPFSIAHALTKPSSLLLHVASIAK